MRKRTLAATQSSTLVADIGAERTSVGATEQLVKRRVSLERIEERSSLLNGKMASPVTSKTGPDHR
jgi:hypothetical protein